jgi:hypothetical protein
MNEFHMDRIARFFYHASTFGEGAKGNTLQLGLLINSATSFLISLVMCR